MRLKRQIKVNDEAALLSLDCSVHPPSIAECNNSAHREGEVPVGLMLAAAGGADRRIFELAAGMEDAIRV